MLAASGRCLFASLLAPMLMCAGSLRSPLTVLVDFESPHSDTSLRSLQDSLSEIMRPSGISVKVQLRSSLPQNPQFAQLVVFKMKGSCTMSPLPIAALSDERGPLAMAYTSDGQVLHFGEVECDRVRHSLQRILGFNSSEKSQRTYGSALAIVMAHEVYHMLGNAMSHTPQGLTKPALSASELMNPDPMLPPAALSAIQQSVRPELPPAKSQ
jgi:hypothetical protein